MWDEELRVRAYEAGTDGKMRADVMLDYMQDAAAGDAERRGFGATHMGAQGLTWVLSRLVLEVERFPAWEERLRLRTWPSGTQGIFATRDFHLTDERGGTLARATTAWFLIDISRRRPARLTEDVVNYALPEVDRALVDDFARIPPIDREQPAQTRVAGLSEIDMNGHVNHVRYGAWSLDALPLDWVGSHWLRKLQVQFRSEARAGDTVVLARVQTEADPLSWNHAVRDKDGKVLAQAQSTWLPG